MSHFGKIPDVFFAKKKDRYYSKKRSIYGHFLELHLVFAKNSQFLVFGICEQILANNCSNMPKTRNCGFPKCHNMDYFTKVFSFFEHFLKTTSGNSAPICNILEFDENMSEYN